MLIEHRLAYYFKSFFNKDTWGFLCQRDQSICYSKNLRTWPSTKAHFNLIQSKLRRTLLLRRTSSQTSLTITRCFQNNSFAAQHARLEFTREICTARRENRDRLESTRMHWGAMSTSARVRSWSLLEDAVFAVEYLPPLSDSASDNAREKSAGLARLSPLAFRGLEWRLPND